MLRVNRNSNSILRKADPIEHQRLTKNRHYSRAGVLLKVALSLPLIPASALRPLYNEQISLIRSIGRIARQPSSNGSTGSSHKTCKDIQSQICLPAELLDIGSRQDFARVGACAFDLATKFLNARAKMCHLFFCSLQLFQGGHLFMDCLNETTGNWLM
jgi:hypothetical protein